VRMRVLLVHAHPVDESFNTSLCRMARETLEASGHDVDFLDLYAENFNPVLSRDERLAYHDAEHNRDTVAPHVERLLTAEALVLVFPVWNYGFPAILKGWFDRVFLPGVSFEMAEGKVRPCLRNIRKMAVVTSYGGSRIRSMLAGDPPRKIIMRMLRATIRPGARVHYLAHYDMNRSTDASRQAFLSKTQRVLEGF
jgi:NAD(P)H dehydrogenase (quinone)